METIKAIKLRKGMTIVMKNGKEHLITDILIRTQGVRMYLDNTNNCAYYDKDDDVIIRYNI